MMSSRSLILEQVNTLTQKENM